MSELWEIWMELEPDEAQRSPALEAFHRGVAALAGGGGVFAEATGWAGRVYAVVCEQGGEGLGGGEPELR